MKPEVREALDFIFKTTGLLKLDRVGHIQIQQACDLIEREYLNLEKQIEAALQKAETQKPPLDTDDKALA